MGHEDSGVKDMVFGSFAGMVAKLFEHPFDLVKVRLQSQPTDRALTFTGPWDCFKQTYLHEGWKGLYRGLSAPLLGAACENACLFLVYGKTQNIILHFRPGETTDTSLEKRQLSQAELALAAAAAGAVTSFVLTPIELIKCRMQVQMLAREGAFGPLSHPHAHTTSIPTTSIHPQTRSITQLASSSSSSTSTSTLHPPRPGLPPLEGPFQLIRSTIRQHGLRGLWLGQIGTLFRETGGSSAWFTAYNLSSAYFLAQRQKKMDSLPNAGRDVPRLTKADLATWELMFSGALAGMSYNIVLFPADSVKSAMQTRAELNPNLPREGFWTTAGRIWSKRGLRGMYAGCGLTVARAAPSSALIFLIYESLSSRMGWIFDR
ncbi:mitochondrial ornithine carrier protein [Tremella mesenterica]|uniref:Mitochondrial ornithine carrier protein n=1 Tax=Tremella mesenterica TaxID=5217 RepID=A0A4Q1BSJ4_TREME|nr:mitochondrial ornithine carrier protein [Tremella mesenterica]